MLPEIETLMIVQDRDQKILALQKDLTQLPTLVANAKLRLQSDQKAVDACKEELQELDLGMKRIQLDVDTRRDTIGKLKVQQFETKKNEEFRALGSEVERYEAEVVSLEDGELELMEQAEEKKAILTEREAKLARTEQLVDQEIAGIEQRGKNSKGEIVELEAARAAEAKKVEPSLLSIYDRLIKSKGGTAVVALVGGQCKGCHMKVTAATVVQAKGSKDVTHCENCGRIVYFDG
ncbi:MAG: C4-type zinc ribbon domain-containing protein [Verrucomicrobiota bacterium]